MSALSDLRRLTLYSNQTLLDTANETYREDSDVEYAYDATTIQRCSAGEHAEIHPNTVEEVMTLPAKAQWKTNSNKVMARL